MKYSKFCKLEAQRVHYERVRAASHEVESARVEAWRAVLEWRTQWTAISKDVRLLLGLPDGLGSYHGTLCTQPAAAGMDDFVHMMNRERSI